MHNTIFDIFVKVIGTENIILIWLDQEVIAHVIHHKTEHEISSGFPQ